MTESTIVEYDGITVELENLKENANFLPDCSTVEGYGKSRRVSLDLDKIKTKLEKQRKKKKARYIEGGKQVDIQAKLILAKLEEIQLPHKDAYKELDNLKKQLEIDRKQKLQDRVDYIRNLPANMADSCSSEVQDAIKSVENEPCLDFYEFTTPALEARNKSHIELMALYAKKLKEETDAEELKELRAKQALQDQKDRDEGIRIEAARKADAEKLEAEQSEAKAKQEVIDAKARLIESEKQAKIDKELAEEQRIETEKAAKVQAKKVEDDRVEALRKARADADQAKIDAKIQADKAAETARLAEIARQEVEVKRLADEAVLREANKKHVGVIRKAAKDALMAHGITEEQAKAIVLAINSKDIPHVSIKY